MSGKANVQIKEEEIRVCVINRKIQKRLA